MIQPNKFSLKAQGRLLKVSAISPSEENIGGKRGKVSTFSRASRLRILQKLHTIQKVSNTHAVYITLTYGQRFPSPTDAKRHLANFLKRIHRRWLYCSGIWRLEFQERGAPHFHIILFGLPFVPKEVIAEWWGSTIGVEYADWSTGTARHPFTRIEALTGFRKVLYYVSKYVAKVADGGFNLHAYLTAEGEFIHPQTGEISETVGRWWGVFNSIWLPVAVVKELELHWGSKDVFYNLRRAAGRLWKGRNNHSRSGWTYFTDNPYEWIRYANYLQNERTLNNA